MPHDPPCLFCRGRAPTGPCMHEPESYTEATPPCQPSCADPKHGKMEGPPTHLGYLINPTNQWVVNQLRATWVCPTCEAICWRKATTEDAQEWKGR